MNGDVVIVGAGPTGLMLACELALAGVRPIVLEHLTAPSDEPKANGLLGQVVRVVDHRGLYERLGGGPGRPQPNSAYFMFAALPLDLSLLAHSPVHALPVPQRRIVQVLEERAIELGVAVRRGHRLAGLAQDPDGVTLHVEGPDGTRQLRASCVVGADGGHSTTRKLAGIEFPGVSYDRTLTRSAHVSVPAERLDPGTGALRVPGRGALLPFLPHRTDHGTFTYAPLPGRPPLVSTAEWDQPEPETPMSLDEMRASIRRVLGADVPVGPPEGEGPHMLRRQVGGNTRVAERYRERRVFLTGDAAHVGTGGGSGLNLGLQDAVNLAWKLAAELRGGAPPGLLDTYETERRPAAERMVMYTQAQGALVAPGGDVTALRTLFTELLRSPETVRHLADLTAGTDVRYDMGIAGAHPVVGGFAPELDLETAAGRVRLAELGRTARPLLLDLTEAGALASDGLDVVAARAVGDDPAVTALLLRPDGYVAWATASPHPTADDLETLHAARRRWFGER
jgi:2-polyprenyl-6-methoxyphenol hydroxylase-like FAD-dependent oxidoreductase